MVRTACCVTRAKRISRSSVNSAVEKRKAPYAASRPTGTSNKTCRVLSMPCKVKLSMMSLNTSGTAMLVSLAVIRQASAKITRPFHAHR